MGKIYKYVESDPNTKTFCKTFGLGQSENAILHFIGPEIDKNFVMSELVDIYIIN